MTVQAWDPSLPVPILIGQAVALQPVPCVARDFVALMMAMGAPRGEGLRKRRRT